MVITRGDVWWVDLPDPIASEPGHKKPVVIIQSDDFNRSRINTIIAVALTTNLQLVDAPGNFILAAKKTGLPRDSVANVSQIITIDKSFLRDKCRRLDKENMRAIDEGVRLVLFL